MKLKKGFAMVLATTMCFGLVACGDSGKGTEAAITEASSVGGETAEKAGGKAILIVNGNLGDLGFFDSANRGMERIKSELGVGIQVIETGDDEAKWEPALADAADEDADWIIAVSPSMVEPIQKLAPDYPEKKFLLIDNTVDFEAADLDRKSVV